MSLFFHQKYFKCSKFKRRTELCGSEDQIVWLGVGLMADLPSSPPVIE